MTHRESDVIFSYILDLVSCFDKYSIEFHVLTYIRSDVIFRHILNQVSHFGTLTIELDRTGTLIVWVWLLWKNYHWLLFVNEFDHICMLILCNNLYKELKVDVLLNFLLWWFYLYFNIGVVIVYYLSYHIVIVCYILYN